MTTAAGERQAAGQSRLSDVDVASMLLDGLLQNCLSVSYRETLLWYAL